MGSLQDANGDPREPWESVGNFSSDNEYFTSAEMGWTSGKDYIYVDNYHVTFWHKDEREEADTPSGWGVEATMKNEQWAAFGVTLLAT